MRVPRQGCFRGAGVEQGPMNKNLYSAPAPKPRSSHFKAYWMIQFSLFMHVVRMSVTKSFTYLGSVMHNNGGSYQEVTR